MPRTSPHTVTYKDLYELSEQLLVDMQTRYAGARRNGTINLDALTHQVETAKTLVRMLKKGLPGKQTDMLELFNQVNK